MRSAEHILFAAMLLAPVIGVGQEMRGNDAIRRVTLPGIGVSPEAIGIGGGVEPLNGSIEWLREEGSTRSAGPGGRFAEMYRRADARALEAAAGAARVLNTPRSCR